VSRDFERKDDEGLVLSPVSSRSGYKDIHAHFLGDARITYTVNITPTGKSRDYVNLGTFDNLEVAKLIVLLGYIDIKNLGALKVEIRRDPYIISAIALIENTNTSKAKEIRSIFTAIYQNIRKNGHVS
jgi:hypothetical protein